MSEAMNRLQPIARVRDVIDRIRGTGWYAPAGTYDGMSSGRPFRHLRCHVCGGAHYADGHAREEATSGW